MRKRILLLLSIYFYYPPSSSISISSFNLIYATFRPFLSLFFSFTTFPPQGPVTRLPPAPSAFTDATLSPSSHKTLSPIFSAAAML